ncbi:MULTISPECIES: phage holin family protein [Cyanophyceae]|uniref:Phage holin family protein n=1 Tax=Leptolyngbya subtilissima DQ-A4 TaxID=2933933 RepID=A0ABV0K1N0_9CYAN|nr:phage holin family protein [Nodosilinea sp. FACHB-141]MBD2111161.1 phage holin family protein [Nodosilinea sp. FACHB-141]
MASSDSTFDQIEGYFRRLWRLMTVLIDTHLNVAVQEANYESRRLISGFILLGIGIGLVTTAVVLGVVASVAFAQSLGLSWLQAIGAVAGVNLLLGLIFLTLGRLRLSGPLMIQTQARLSRSIALLKAKE